MTKPTDRQIVTAAVELLQGGLLASALPARLMDDYGLSAEQARTLAGRAVTLWKESRPPKGENGGIRPG